MKNKYFTSKSSLYTYNFNVYHCDALGSPRKMTDERGSTIWSATYYPFGEIDRWIVSKSFYDGFGRLIQTKNFDYDNTRTITQSISYNGNGLKDSVSNPYEISGTSMSYSSPNWGSLDITSYEYDGLNRIAKVIHPDAKTIMVKYYANTDTIIDEKGNKTIHIYNAYGALDMVINALNDTTCYQYDTLGRLIKVTDAEKKETEYYYDELSRLKGVNGPDAKSPYFYNGDSVDVLYDEYDDLGNLKLKKDPNGWVKYTYDNINRLTKIELSTNGGTTWSDKVKFTYDSLVGVAPTYLRNPKGRLSRMITCGVDTIKYYYDDRGRLGIKRVNIAGLTGAKTINYRFNYANLCTLINISPSYKTTYQYNRLGQTKSIPNLASTFKYNPDGQIVKLNYTNSVIDTITYDNRLRPTQIRVKKISDIMKLGYTYQDNSNVASITDYINNNYTQTYAYDDLNRLTTVTSSAGNQSFTYDKVGNRTSKNSTNYQYYTHTNRLAQDHRNYTYDYDDNGNIIRHQSNSSTVDSFAYDWNNRFIYYEKGTEEIDFAYNASGLRVKKHYHITDDPKGSGEFGSLFFDASNDLGIKSRGPDSIYNKGRDIEKVWVKNSPQYLDFTLIHRHVFNEPGRLKLFITLDLDTIPNSGRITLPEDTLTKVPNKCAWEYCIYVNDNDYGFYQTNGAKVSMPFGMLVVKTPGPSGIIKVKISKSLINNPDAFRYTIATFAPSQPPNFDTLFQGGSSAVDVFPGTKETFGGEINGYGESTPLGDKGVKDYTIYYLYNGINPIAEYAPNGSVLARYIYAGGRHIAKIAGADTHWYHCDALGSPRKMTDERGSTIWSATYYPFGEMTAGSNNTHGFTGKEFDSEMGLNYFCQRYYDPEIGRFTTLDTWSNLPDDERLLSYEKCMSWNNYMFKYSSQTPRNIEDYRTKLEKQKRAYNTLQNAVISTYPGVNIPFNNSRRYIAYNHQLNGYLYCRNNPLKYIDPDGHFALVVIIIIRAAGVIILGYFGSDMANEFRNMQMVAEYWIDNYGADISWSCDPDYHWDDWIDNSRDTPGGPYH